MLGALLGWVANALEWLGRAIVALPVWLGRAIARGLRLAWTATVRSRAGTTASPLRAAVARRAGAWRTGPQMGEPVLGGLDERTSAFRRVAARHVRARTSRRLLAIAVLVILAVLAARVEAAPRASVPPVIASDSCDDEGCEDDPLADVIPRVVTAAGSRAEVSGGARELTSGDGCDCTGRLPVPVSAVAEAAIRAAGLDDDPVPGWNRRARLAGLVPTISARAGRNLTWREIDDPTLGYTTMIDIRATWHLERLMFDPNELRISAMDVSRRREKRRVEMLATHTYAAWLAVARGSGRAALLAADLDAITDGWFSSAIAVKP